MSEETKQTTPPQTDAKPVASVAAPADKPVKETKSPKVAKDPKPAKPVETAGGAKPADAKPVVETSQMPEAPAPGAAPTAAELLAD